MPADGKMGTIFANFFYKCAACTHVHYVKLQRLMIFICEFNRRPLFLNGYAESPARLADCLSRLVKFQNLGNMIWLEGPNRSQEHATTVSHAKQTHTFREQPELCFFPYLIELDRDLLL
jgi:hypothetical protein